MTKHLNPKYRDAWDPFGIRLKPRKWEKECLACSKVKLMDCPTRICVSCKGKDSAIPVPDYRDVKKYRSGWRSLHYRKSKTEL